MECRREKSSSGEMFSFPSTPITPDSDFEFGSITPDSPSTFNNSPADHLFLNGRLLPHFFPPQHQTAISAGDIFRPASSKGSFTSSRSNSSNSRSSSSGSGRTSASDAVFPERSGFDMYRKKGSKPAVSAQVYGCSQRWQFIATVPAAVSRENSRRKRVEGGERKGEMRRERGRTGKKKKKKKKKRKMWIGRKVFRWIIMVCKECHAIEPARKDDVMRKTKMR